MLSLCFRNYVYEKFHRFPGFRILHLLQQPITTEYLKKIRKNNWWKMEITNQANMKKQKT